MWVLEIYQSRQGEGIWTGYYSVFVRLLGCPLRCRYCDTVYARHFPDKSDVEIGADLSPEEIAGRVLLLDQHHVVLTGGEPMHSNEISLLTKLLKDFDYLITIETAGIFLADVYCDLMSISPKLSNSKPINENNNSDAKQHDEHYSKPEIVKKLIARYNYQLKFVVDTPQDLNEIDSYIENLPNVIPERVLLMPQATDIATMDKKAQWIIPHCESHGFSYCPRMQIVWYGNKQRT
ncbi:MAG: 7-carboxy-7-deazaguanine synthase QueE [Planctomycetaceae bacterium]|jgi:7-carboxy-7-deazaguanine synthase|nr:7-carboxy-7-deazaguanine synthase QueE [Planctomycetaceae bacterium]